MKKSKLDPKDLAVALGAEHVGKVKARSGHFGAMQLIAEVQSRFRVPKRGGRATDPTWTERRLIPLAPSTLKRLDVIAKELEIAPLQVAALLLEEGARVFDAESITSSVEEDALVRAWRDLAIALLHRAAAHGDISRRVVDAAAILTDAADEEASHRRRHRKSA